MCVVRDSLWGSRALKTSNQIVRGILLFWFSRLFGPSHPIRNIKIIIIELLEFVFPELLNSSLSKSAIIFYISAENKIGANSKTAAVTNHDDILEYKICLVNVWNNYEPIHSFQWLRYYWLVPELCDIVATLLLGTFERRCQARLKHTRCVERMLNNKLFVKDYYLK